MKICGIRRVEDAIAAVESGTDFIGLIFVPGSRRTLDPVAAAAIVEEVRGRSTEVRTVGVFVNEQPETIRTIAARVGLDLIQFHGSESDDEIRAVGLPAIRVTRVAGRLPETVPDDGCEWMLYDTWVDGERGGTGRTFDWSLLRSHPRHRRFFLSGGLAPENVRQAITVVRPDAIDLSSGVEDEPGVKNHKRIEALMRQVQR